MHGHKIINQNSLHYVTLTVVGWLDVFSIEIYRKEVVKCLQFSKAQKSPCFSKQGLFLIVFIVEHSSVSREYNANTLLEPH
jgi:hypothetical protein